MNNSKTSGADNTVKSLIYGGRGGGDSTPSHPIFRISITRDAQRENVILSLLIVSEWALQD